MKTRNMYKQRSLREVRVTKYEVMSDGQAVPVYEPRDQSKRIKTRKYNEALGQYTKDLRGYLNKGYKILRVEDYKVGVKNTDEEKLVKLTHKVLVLELSGSNKEVNCLVPRSSKSYYKHLNIEGIRNIHHKYISDDNGVAFVSFTLESSENLKTVIKFTIMYVDFYTFHVTEHTNELTIDFKEKLKFDFMLSRGIVCVVWVQHNFCSSWNFTGGEVEFINFNITEDLQEAFFFTLDHDYLMVSSNDDDFLDSVFSSDDASMRMTSYYSCRTGESFNTKKAIAEILEQDPLEHVSDIVFLNIPSDPKWMVLEWMLPEMTLSHVFIYKYQDGVLVKEGILNFQNDFSEYKTYFGKLNELQSKVVITRSPWRAFLWTSWNHVLIIDLNTYDVVGILRTDLSMYKDFKNEIYDFQLDVSRSAHKVTLFVKLHKEIVFFCTFDLSPTLTLNQLSLKKVIHMYSPTDIVEMNLTPDLQAEISNAY